MNYHLLYSKRYGSPLSIYLSNGSLVVCEDSFYSTNVSSIATFNIFEILVEKVIYMGCSSKWPPTMAYCRLTMHHRRLHTHMAEVGVVTPFSYGVNNNILSCSLVRLNSVIQLFWNR